MKENWQKEQWRYCKWSYYRHVEQVDAEIGLLLDGLGASASAENTVVIFVGDHGEGLAHHRMVRKEFAYDEASRVPLIIRSPSHVKGGQIVSDSPVSGMYIVPTVCKLAGISSPPLSRGKSLLPLLQGSSSESTERMIVCDVPNDGGRVVRSSRYKYITYANDPPISFST